MDKIKALFVGASCTIFAFFTYYNYKRLFGGGGDKGNKYGGAADVKLNVVRVSQP